MHRRGGFTLVELCVVLVLVAILSTMTVSFSTLVSGYTKNNRAEYEFMEQCAELKEELTLWVSQEDGVGVTFTYDNNQLKANNGEPFGYANTQVESIEYDSKGKLLRCTVTARNGKQQSFVLYLRCGGIDGGTGNE